MNDTRTLIAALSAEITPGVKPRSPYYWASRTVGALTLYALAVQVCLGVRPDLAARVQDGWFLAEVVLLTGIALSGGIASMIAMYPDRYQSAGWTRVPMILSVACVGLLVAEFLSVPNASAILVAPNPAMECASCIAMVAVPPSMGLFWLLRKGAPITRYQAGAVAVLTASAIGCVTLRIAEPTDMLVHLVLGHYLPTLLLASLGALLGGKLLRW